MVDRTVVLVTFTYFCLEFQLGALKAEECVERELGMQSGSLPDSSISASSSYGDTVSPEKGRLHMEVEGGAWCPKYPIKRDSYEYLQVDLGELHNVTMVAVQGRFGNGVGHEWAKAFRLEYQKGAGKWQRYKPFKQGEVLAGNTDTYNVVYRKLDPPIFCTKIRFIPHSHIPKTVCMRVELFGCTASWRLLTPLVIQEAVSVVSTQIYIKWTAAPADEIITSYVLSVQEMVNGPAKYVDNITTNTTNYTVTDLKPSTQYTIQMYSQNTVDQSPAVYINVTTAAAPPVHLQVVGVSLSEIHVKWDAPPNDDRITGYDLAITEIDADTMVMYTLPAHINNFTLNDLKPSTEYEIRLNSKNMEGRSTLVKLQVRTAVLHNLVVNPQAIIISSSVVDVKWTAPQDDTAITAYQVTFTDKHGGVVSSVEVPRGAHNYVMGNLKHNTKYRIRISSKTLQTTSPGTYLYVETPGKEDCVGMHALGMESGDIADEAITASSYFSDIVAPEYARIRKEIAGGAWCPKQTITSETYEFLQIDLKHPTKITNVEIMGRFANGMGLEYAKAFRLEYQVEDGGRWQRYTQDGGKEIMDGNTNTYIAEIRTLTPPITCIRIRFIPYSDVPMTVCMRVEMYGCKIEGQSTVTLTKPPLNLKAVAVSDMKVHVTWDPPSVDDVITGYTLVVHYTNDSVSTQFDLQAGVSSWDLKGLSPGATYTIKLSGHNEFGQGDAAVVHVTTPYKDSCSTTACPEHSVCHNIHVIHTLDWFIPKCVCDDGFHMDETRDTCVDTDECTSRDVCSQTCRNIVGGYQCECKQGFTLASHGSCKANGDTQWLYYTSRVEVRRLHDYSGFEQILVDGRTNVTALDYDYEESIIFFSDAGSINSISIPEYKTGHTGDLVSRAVVIATPIIMDQELDSSSPTDIAVDWLTKRVYWVDGVGKKIKSVDYHGNMIKTLIDDIDELIDIVLDPEHGSPTDIAVDWLTKRVYWVDGVGKKIKSVDYHGNMIKTLIDDIDELIDIVLDPEHGYIHWTACSETPYIGRIGMDGSNYQRIHSCKNMPSRLTMDYVNNRLYWVDAQRHVIESSNVDGSDHTIVMMNPLIRRPSSLAVFEDILWWIDADDNSIYSVNRRTARDLQRRAINKTSITDLKVHQIQMQSNGQADVYQSLCGEADCEQICVPSQTEVNKKLSKVTCTCGDGFIIQDDGKSCVPGY